MKTLGDRILEIRKEKRLTQSELSKASGVSRVSISQWEQGINQPRGESLIALAKYLECEPDWLLHGNRKNSTKSLPKSNSVNELLLSYQPHLTSFVKLDFYEIEVSGGYGSLVIKEEEKSNTIVFSQEFLNTELCVKESNIFLMKVRGDSMLPTLKNQTLIMVNKINEFAGDGIYVFRFDGQLMVKRLKFTKRGLTVGSDNAATYPAWELTRVDLKNEYFEIIGEVIWSGQRI